MPGSASTTRRWPRLYDIPEESDPAFRRIPQFYHVWETAPLRLMENSFDNAHFSFVHRATFGQQSLPKPEKYEITDTTTLRGYYDALSQAYQVKGDLDKAIAYSDKAGALESKEQEKAMRGHSLRARALALKASTDTSDAKFAATFKAELKKRISAQPYELVKDRLVGLRGQAKMISRALIESSLSTSLDPLIAAANGSATGDIAGALVQAKATLDIALPLIPYMAEVYGEIIDAQANAKAAASKWETRLVELASSDAGSPVASACGTRARRRALQEQSLDQCRRDRQRQGRRRQRLRRRPARHRVQPGPPPDDRTARLTRRPEGRQSPAHRLHRGLTGHAGRRSERGRHQVPGVLQEPPRRGPQELRRRHEPHRQLRPRHARRGIVVAGNPFARLVHVTENWPWKSIPDEAPTIELGERWGDNCKQAVAYLRKANVRVVNMSWRVGRAAFEGMLAAKGVGATPEERAELSRKIFKPFRDGLEEAIRSAPDILFVAGSGNEDNDVDFAEYIPAGLRLPNLLTVGAIDDQDRFTISPAPARTSSSTPTATASPARCPAAR